MPATVRVPRPGGDLFVASLPWSSLRHEQRSAVDRTANRALQADLNAAANIGLRSLLDPDWTGRWWYVPCETATSRPVADRIAGSLAFEGVDTLPTADAGSLVPVAVGEKRAARKGSKKARDKVNLWRDPSARALSEGQWRPTSAYWNSVQLRVIELLRRCAGLEG